MTVVLVLTRHAYIGLSSDTKPLDGGGGTFYETDTGNSFIFDGVGTWWRTPPLSNFATIPIPLSTQLTALPLAGQRARDYTHLQHGQGTT